MTIIVNFDWHSPKAAIGLAEILKIHQLPYGVVQLRSDNILAFRPDVKIFKEYDLDILGELLEVFQEITEGKPRLYLCDNRHITGIVNKEEQAYMNEHWDSFAYKSGIITHSPVMKILVNSYNTVFQPKMEIKLFNNEEKAVSWLLSD